MWKRVERKPWHYTKMSYMDASHEPYDGGWTTQEMFVGVMHDGDEEVISKEMYQQVKQYWFLKDMVVIIERRRDEQ